jgi:hypothetical protein
MGLNRFVFAHASRSLSYFQGATIVMAAEAGIQLTNLDSVFTGMTPQLVSAERFASMAGVSWAASTPPRFRLALFGASATKPPDRRCGKDSHSGSPRK